MELNWAYISCMLQRAKKVRKVRRRHGIVILHFIQWNRILPGHILLISQVLYKLFSRLDFGILWQCRKDIQGWLFG